MGLLKSLLIAHRGLDGWLGEYILVLLDSGHFYKCEIPGWLHNAEDYQLQCTTFDDNKHWAHWFELEYLDLRTIV